MFTTEVFQLWLRMKKFIWLYRLWVQIKLHTVLYSVQLRLYHNVAATCSAGSVADRDHELWDHELNSRS
jgi:hypothetical protein